MVWTYIEIKLGLQILQRMEKAKVPGIFEYLPFEGHRAAWHI